MTGSGDFTAAKQLRVESVGDDLVLYGNSNTSLTIAEFSIKLVGVESLSAAIFALA